MTAVAALLAISAAAPDFLLPGDAAPAAYRLELRIDPARPVFEGAVRIDVDLRKPLSTIWLNATGIDVAEASVESGGRILAARAVAAGGEFLSLDIGEAAGPGRAVLAIRYRAKFSESAPVGVFRRRHGGGMAVFTTFTAIDARRAFPCFDEPRFQTPWDIAIRVPRALDAYANAPVAAVVQEPGGWKTVRFATTEPLATQVVAFAVGRFERVDGGVAGAVPTPVGVVVAPGRRAEAGEAIRATRAVLPRLEAYTGIPHPYAKLDHIALPDSAFGATENPGLIAYRAASLLVAPGAAPARLTALRGLVAHEIAHQWFGNLVSPASWEDVWLSEGFATWLAARLLDEEQPASRRRLAVVAARERIMEADAGDGALPVRSARRSRAGMADVYNRFVYQKGAAVLWMLEGWIGEERFRDGLREYLARHRRGPASTADLAAALRDRTGIGVAAVLSSFLDRAGVPELRAAIACDGGPRLEFEQTGAGLWSIPVCWKTDAGGRGCAVAAGRRHTVALGGACPAWVYPNAEGAGYYRTETPLPAEALAALTAAERLALAHDLRASRRAGRLGPDGEMLLARLAADQEPEVARAAAQESR
jgi:alanyl aminopeptidase